MSSSLQRWVLGLICLCMCPAIPAYAGTRIAILEFELKDLTLSPRIQEETERAASLKPLLQEVLKSKGDYELINIGSDMQRSANLGTGYLFDHQDVVAALGQQFGADFVVMGRVHKASHLFVYFLVHLVDVKTQRLVGDYVVEVKGPQKKLTIKGVESLAEQIHHTLNTLQ
ncbi:MAG: DUF2380 domain-containing protein [Gammaproteobacteria bacterium]